MWIQEVICNVYIQFETLEAPKFRNVIFYTIIGPHNSSNVQNSSSSRSSGNTTDYLSAAPKSKNLNGDVGIDIDSNETALRPANDNRMALTLLLLLDQANRECQSARDEVRKKCYEPNSLMPLGRHERECFYRNIGGERIEEPEFQPSSSPIQLIVCNIPLPCSLSAETVCPDILAFQCQQRLRDKAATSAMATASNSAYSGLGFLGNVQPSQPVESVRYARQREYPREQISDYRNLPENGPCVIVLRGLSIGILRAVRAIKQLVATKLWLPRELSTKLQFQIAKRIDNSCRPQTYKGAITYLRIVYSLFYTEMLRHRRVNKLTPYELAYKLSRPNLLHSNWVYSILTLLFKCVHCPINNLQLYIFASKFNIVGVLSLQLHRSYSINDVIKSTYCAFGSCSFFPIISDSYRESFTWIIVLCAAAFRRRMYSLGEF